MVWSPYRSASGPIRMPISYRFGWYAVSAEGGRKKKREKKKREKKNLELAALSPRYPSPAGDFFTSGRSLLPVRGEETSSLVGRRNE
ncbi:hypothetical protein BHM03_00046998, partial [Ensete ventricosum]